MKCAGTDGGKNWRNQDWTQHDLIIVETQTTQPKVDLRRPETRDNPKLNGLKLDQTWTQTTHDLRQHKRFDGPKTGNPQSNSTRT